MIYSIVEMEVLLSMSRRFFFRNLWDWCMSMRVLSFFSDLSNLPHLALTLMSACMREARARTHSYTSRRDSEKKQMAHT